MNVVKENENPLKYFTSSWEIWDFLEDEAGLDVENYDHDIVEELCNRLSITLPCKDIGKELKKRNISSELFIGAFLKAIQPYAHMMSDLCAFFYLHGVKRTNREIKVLFDFGKGPKDLGFDLEHFREVLSKYCRISQHVAIYGWNDDTLWILARIFEEYRRYNPQDPTAKTWLHNYVEKREFGLPRPISPVTEVEEIDLWLQRTWQVWATIIFECRKYGSSRDDLRKCSEAQRKDLSENTQEFRESEELPVEGFKEIADLFKEWNIRTLSILDSDRWPEMMLRGLFGLAETLVKVEKDERVNIAKDKIQKIRQLFSNLPRWEGIREVVTKEFLELLGLPIWKMRHELYQTWILTQIDKALHDYQRVVHHVNGELVLKFSGTHVGTIETKKGAVHIWSELRSPLANPLGKGRKGNIQPDYSLTFEPVTVPSQTIVAIECKQYRKANPKNFADALTDYARGRPNAKILLLSYGEIPKKTSDLIDNSLKVRTIAIGNFMPGKSEEIEIFKQLLLQSLGESAREREVKASLRKTQFDMIAVDISGSMKKPLEEKRILEILQMVVSIFPNAMLLAVDTGIRKEWVKAENAISELLSLPRDGGTDLPKALSSHNLEKAVILTDNDGFNQLGKIETPPCWVIEVGTEKTLHFHFRD